MVPMERFSFEQRSDNDGEHHQRHSLLNHLELHQRIGSSIAIETNAIGRHGQTVFKEGDTPRKHNHTNQRPRVTNLHLLQLQMAIPCQGHQHIGPNQKQYGINTFHILCFFIIMGKFSENSGFSEFSTHFLRQQFFLHIGHAAPQAVACFGIQPFQFLEDAFHLCPV